MSFSCKQNNEGVYNEHHNIEKNKHSDLCNMKGIRSFRPSKKSKSNVLGAEQESDKKTTPVKNNFFNDFDSFSATGEYFNQGLINEGKSKHNAVDSAKISGSNGDINEIEIDAFKKSQIEGKILQENDNMNINSDIEKQCLLTLSRNEVKVDDEIIEKYCNILNQRTVTSLDDKSKTYKSFVKNLNNTTFTKEANRTVGNSGRQKSKLNNRCMSQCRPKETPQSRKSNDNKSGGRGSSKRSAIRNKMKTNSSSTRNTKNITCIKTEPSNMITKRVGGGYSSYAYDPNQESKQKPTNTKEPAAQRNQSKYNTKVK